MKNSLKLLHFTDVHARGNNPKYRKDHFPTTILEKLMEVGHIASEFKVDAGICTGDLYDIPDVSNTIMCDVGRYLSVGFPHSERPLYGIIGNHDEFGQNPEFLSKTALGVHDADGVYNLIPPEGLVYKIQDEDENAINILILGVHSTALMDHRLDDYIGRRTFIKNDIEIQADYVILCVHGFITDKRWPEGVPYTLINDIVKVTQVDMILTGHEHSGFGVVKRGGVTFCNPSSLGRLTASHGDMGILPKVAIINITVDRDGIDSDIRLVHLECARPSEEVIDREELEKVKLQAENINTVKTQLADFRIKTIDPLVIVNEVARLENENGFKFNDEVVAETVRRINQATVNASSRKG